MAGVELYAGGICAVKPTGGIRVSSLPAGLKTPSRLLDSLKPPQINQAVQFMTGLFKAFEETDGSLVEIIELPDHPWFVAGQFHPEFRSRPWEPHPLFAAFIKAALDHQGGA